MRRKFILVLFIIIILGAVFYLDGGKDESVYYPRKYSVYVKKYANQYDLDENLVYSIIKAESKFQKDAVSRRGAKGLMQIADITRDWAIERMKLDEDIDIYDPETNIKVGCWYLNTLYKEFGDTELVIAAYNGGTGNVKKWLQDKSYSKDGKKLDVIPFVETKTYVAKVKQNYEQYNKLYSN